MYDELYGRDVKASCCYVCCDQNRAGMRRGRETFNGAKACFLGHLRMQSVDNDIEILEKWY